MTGGGRARPFGTAQVRGPSMSPTLCDGDRVVVRYGVAVRPGAVVILRHPRRPDLLMIKRAVRRTAPGAWWVLGDNPFASTGDSAEFGAVPDDLVLATAFLRVRLPVGARASVRWWLTWAGSAVRRLRPDDSASARLRGNGGDGPDHR